VDYDHDSSPTMPDSLLKIGCIGPLDSVNVIQEVVETYYPQVCLLTYVEEKITDAWKVLDQCQRETSGTLFTGIGVQESAKAMGQIINPYEHIPRGPYSLIRALWELQHDKKKIHRISIDVVTDEILEDIKREFHIHFEKIYTMPFAPHVPEQAYEDYHLKLFREGKIDAVISGFGAVYEKLKQKQIPVFRLYPSGFQIRNNLENLLGQIRVKNLRSAGIAIQIIHLKSIVQHSINQYDDLKKEGQFYLELLEYVRGVQGSLFHLGREYVIYSPRGGIESQIHMDHFKQLLLWARKRNIVIASGIGIGLTAFEAEKSARKALRNAEKLEKSGFYIVHNDHIRGPLGESDELGYPIQVSDANHLKISKEIGINASYLGKIKALIQTTGKDTFDSNDLATCLGIGERSARRILKKFLDSGHATLLGKESSHQVGRPKNLIKLQI